MDRSEHIARGNCEPAGEPAPGVVLREFVSARVGARALSTGTVTCAPGAVLPYHTHEFSEAITVLEGEGLIEVEGRRYRLRRGDAIHVPAGTPHTAANARDDADWIAHWAFASDTPGRTLVKSAFAVVDRDDGCAALGDPEFVARCDRIEPYELAPNTRFRDLFAGRFGAAGLCGGWGEFGPGASLPCHVHQYDESITIVAGRATCEVAGRRYRLGGCDTACVPEGLPHRFLNESDEPMAMVWVYAGSEPERTLVDVGYCTGALKLPVEA